MIFTAGLSILFCLSAGDTTDRTIAPEPLNALAACESLLQTMGALLPDARHYAIVFEALRRNFARKTAQPRKQQSALVDLPGGSGPFNGSTIMPETPMLDQNTEYYQQSQIDPASSIRFDASNATNTGLNMQHMDNSGHIYVASTEWPLPTNGSGNTTGVMPQNQPPEDDILQWAFLNDGTIWDIEAGLGEYAYGDLTVNTNLFNRFDFNL